MPSSSRTSMTGSMADDARQPQSERPASRMTATAFLAAVPIPPPGPRAGGLAPSRGGVRTAATCSGRTSRCAPGLVARACGETNPCTTLRSTSNARCAVRIEASRLPETLDGPNHRPSRVATDIATGACGSTECTTSKPCRHLTSKPAMSSDALGSSPCRTTTTSPCASCNPTSTAASRPTRRARRTMRMPSTSVHAAMAAASASEQASSTRISSQSRTRALTSSSNGSTWCRSASAEPCQGKTQEMVGSDSRMESPAD